MMTLPQFKLSNPAPKIIAVVSFLVAIPCSMAQGFYGPNEYMDHPPQPSPPSMYEFTHLAPPPPPPSSPANAWHRDGYRRGDVLSPYSSPVYGQFHNPTESERDGWNDPVFIPYSIPANYGYGEYQPGNSGACIDGNCIGGETGASSKAKAVK